MYVECEGQRGPSEDPQGPHNSSESRILHRSISRVWRPKLLGYGNNACPCHLPGDVGPMLVGLAHGCIAYLRV
jgi:hypothetical protein